MIDVFGIPQASKNATYQRALEAAAERDSRFALRSPVPPDRTVAVLRNYDVLAVPSRWLETGPLVVLEAFGAGIPVIGSNIGGIPELLTDGIDGLLVQAGDVGAFAAGLQKLLSSELRAKLRKGVRRPKLMSEVAKDMSEMYAELCLPSLA
jgi:glycosyltransferase involved in cell wall biosynthesis